MNTPANGPYVDPRLCLDGMVAQRVARLLRAGYGYEQHDDGWFYIHDTKATPVEMGEAWRLIAQNLA